MLTVLLQGCSAKDPLDWWRVDAFMRMHLRSQPGRGGPFLAGAGRDKPCEGTEGAREEGEVHPGRKAAWAAVVTDSDVLSYRRGHFPTVQERAAVSESCCRSGISSSEKNVLPKMKNRNEYSCPRGNGLL